MFFHYLSFCPHFPITLVVMGVRKIDQYSLSKCSMLGVSEEIGTISLSRKYFFLTASGGWVEVEVEAELGKKVFQLILGS